jgi:hypothetical protein
MGRANVPLLTERTLASMAEGTARALVGDTVTLFGWEIAARDLAMLIV